MSVITGHDLAIETGVTRVSLADSAFSEGEGDRSRDVEIRFQGKYRGYPAVQAALAGVDGGDWMRVSIGVKSVGFDRAVLSVRTWHDTRISSLEISWLAAGFKR